jgi:hypothetical protein
MMIKNAKRIKYKLLNALSGMKEVFYCAIALKRTLKEKEAKGADYQHASLWVIAIEKDMDELLYADCSGFHAKEQAFIQRLIKKKQEQYPDFSLPDESPSGQNTMGSFILSII